MMGRLRNFGYCEIEAEAAVSVGEFVLDAHGDVAVDDGGAALGVEGDEVERDRLAVGERSCRRCT